MPRFPVLVTGGRDLKLCFSNSFIVEQVHNSIYINIYIQTTITNNFKITWSLHNFFNQFVFFGRMSRFYSWMKRTDYLSLYNYNSIQPEKIKNLIVYFLTGTLSTGCNSGWNRQREPIRQIEPNTRLRLKRKQTSNSASRWKRSLCGGVWL